MLVCTKIKTDTDQKRLCEQIVLQFENSSSSMDEAWDSLGESKSSFLDAAYVPN